MKSLVTGVVGAGAMGTGVAQSLAQVGHRVILVDISAHILQQARENIVNNLRLQKMLRKATFQESVDELVKRITFTSDIEALRYGRKSGQGFYRYK